MDTTRKATVGIVVVAALVFTSSFAWEYMTSSRWPTQELGYTSAGDGFYQLAWDSEGELQLAYIGVYGPYYALLYGQRVGGEWDLTCLSYLSWDHEGASIALDSQDRVYVCTSLYKPVMNLYGQHILFATNAGGEWESEMINITGYPSSAKVAIDAQDNVHLIYSRDTGQSTVNMNSSIIDMIRTPQGWDSTILKESYIPYRVFSIDDVDSRPDGSIGMIYTTYDLLGWDTIISWQLNYSVISNGELTDATVIPNLGGYPGEKSLCHDASGNAYISAYRSKGDNYSLCYFTNADGDWESEDVAYGGNEKGYGTGVAITVDSDGDIHMGYFVEDYDGETANHTVRYCTNADGAWKVQILDDCQGWSWEESIAIATDESRDVHVVYYQKVRIPDSGETSVTVYVTSQLDPDRFEYALYDSGLRTALVGFVAVAVVGLIMHRRRKRREHQEWMDVTGLHEDR